MNFRIIPTILSVTLILTVSCSGDFTSLAPHSERNVDNFYNTATDIEIAVNGIYDALQSGGTYGNQAGLATGGAGGYWMLIEMRSDNTDQGGDVSGLSASIAVVNQFIEDPLNEYVLGAWVGSYQGIARANIVLSNIGGVEMDQSLKDRFTGEALFLRSLFYYNLAILFENIPMPLTATVSIDENLEQVTAATVFTQISADLVEAISKLSASTTVASGGRATRGAAQTLLAKVYLQTGDKSSAATILNTIISSGVYSLQANYADIWGPSNANNGESIFEVQFQSGGFGEGSGYANSFSPSPDLVGGGPTGGRNRPTRDMIAAWEPGDSRFLGSMDTMYVNAAGDTITGVRYVTKYLSMPFGDFDADDNFIVFRYADVLLMLAEANGSYATLNEVRNRAGLADVANFADLGYASFDALVLHERRVELAFENHRWFDLLRLGDALAVMEAHMTEELYTVPASHRLLYAIPQREVDLGLTQNPGY